MQLMKSNQFFRIIIYHRIWINLGDSLFYVVLMWLLYDLTKNPFYTAIGGFMFSLSDALNFFCGPIIDRCNKRWLLLVTSAIQFLTILLLYIFSVNGFVSVFLLLCSIPIFDLMSKMTYSIHNVMVPSFVKQEELVTANAILSITNTGIDFVFNAITGVLLAVLYIQTIFLLNSSINLMALLIAIVAFRNIFLEKNLMINKVEQKSESLKEMFQFYWKDLKNGLIFLQNKTIRSLMLPLVGLSLFYAMMIVNLPVFAGNIFDSPIGYGFLLVLFAVGSMIGSIVSSYLTKCFTVGKLLPILFLLGGLSWILMLFFVKLVPIIGFILIVIASGILGIVNVIFGTIFQQLPPENMIGRVNTVNLSLIAVASLVGSLLGGLIVKISDCFVPFILCGIGYLIIALLMQTNTLVKRLPNMSSIDSSIL